MIVEENTNEMLAKINGMMSKWGRHFFLQMYDVPFHQRPKKKKKKSQILYISEV